MCHVWGDEGLKGLLGKWAPMLLERTWYPRMQRVVLLGLHLLLMKLMRHKHSGWLEIRQSGKHFLLKKINRDHSSSEQSS